MPGYFSNFSKILYADAIAVNILQRVNLLNQVKSYGAIFYPYIVKDGERASDLAFDYYGRSDLDWIIYLCNDIIDPVTQWPKGYLDFERYIEKTYGTLQASQSRVVYYKRAPITYYVSNVDGSVLSAPQYTPGSNGYNYTKVVQDNSIEITPQSYSQVIDPSNWLAVYAYDDEYAKNEAKRSIRLIDKDYSAKMQKDLSSLLSK